MLPTGNLKHLLQFNGAWWRYYEKNQESIRPVVVDNVIKMLSCGDHIRGFVTYACSNPNCSHFKRIPFTCKSRFCPSCGKKATNAWIRNQMDILPKTSWQHITFTMPSDLWEIFRINRHLLNELPGLASQCILVIAKVKKIVVGLFGALHTFGRDLKYNPHMHVSTTTGGIDNKNQWKTIFFKKKSLCNAWKYKIISLLRTHYKNNTLTLPEPLRQFYPDYSSFNKWLNGLYQKIWIIHCSKPSKNPYHNVNYLGRYIKRPPIAQSRLKHYDGNEVIFNFLNHKTANHENFHCSTEEFIERFIQHIPEKYFRLIRYYGFLANRNRKKYLPMVYTAINQQPKESFPLRFNQLMKKELGFDPLLCILCNSKLYFVSISLGLNHQEIKKYHKNLALMKPCAA
jgi:hypothetical protein